MGDPACKSGRRYAPDKSNCSNSYSNRHMLLHVINGTLMLLNTRALRVHK